MAPRPEIALSEDGRTASTRIDVLTYNIEGLAWPARSGRGPKLKEIGARLAAMRAAGTAPDVILFQEMFSPRATRAVTAADYPALVAGPARSAAQPPRAGPRLPGRRVVTRGEIGIKLLSGGLAIASEYPILTHSAQPFPRRACAGIDCLANKGVLHARIAIPGVPGTLDLFNTHMNSQRASRAPEDRRLAAHRRQSRAISEFVALEGDIARPMVLGGDFNMRHSEPRFDRFSEMQPIAIVHRWCSERPEECDVRMSWDGDEPWRDTQDLQLFWSGEGVTIRPLRVEAMFDGGATGPRLSDHDGFRVTYELNWPAGMPGGACAG